MKILRRTLAAIACLAVALVLVGSSAVPASAQVPPPPRPNLIVAVSDNPDPAASGGQVLYVVTVKNDGTTKARNVVVTIPMPAGTAFVKCTMVLIAGSSSTPCTPGLSNGTVTINLGNIRAHKKPRISLTLTMPSVSAVSKVTLTADANGDGVNDDKNSANTTVLPPGSFVSFLPSGAVAPIACGDTLTPEAFGTDTIARLSGDLGCTSGPWGLKITASGTTLDLNKAKIFRSPTGLTAGSVGILVSDATGVTIVGGSTNGISGIEYFDWCVRDEGATKNLSVNSLRCYRARTAGIDIASENAQVTGVKIDRVAGGKPTDTAGLPGGVGIRTRADNTHIKDSIVLRTSTVGIWVAGADADGSGRVALIDGNTSTMQIQPTAGRGLFLEGGPHSVKDVLIKGTGATGVTTDGVVVDATGVDNTLDGLVVKSFGGNGFVVNGTGTDLSRSSVDGIGLDGFVVAGTGSVLSGNDVQNARHGFIVSGAANRLETNDGENLAGDGYVVTGDGASFANNGAKGNGGVAYRIGAGAGSYDTNNAENNAGDGFLITGSNNTFKSNKSESNDGVGFNVPGTGNHFNTNAASINAGAGEWVIGPGQIDDGGNKVNGSTFSIPPGGGTFNKPSGP